MMGPMSECGVHFKASLIGEAKFTHNELPVHSDCWWPGTLRGEKGRVVETRCCRVREAVNAPSSGVHAGPRDPRSLALSIYPPLFAQDSAEASIHRGLRRRETSRAAETTFGKDGAKTVHDINHFSSCNTTRLDTGVRDDDEYVAGSQGSWSGHGCGTKCSLPTRMAGVGHGKKHAGKPWKNDMTTRRSGSDRSECDNANESQRH